MKYTGTIKVIPTSGLANRLRVIAFSIRLARESDKQLIIYWHADKYLNAEFNDLFEMPGNIIVKQLPLKFKVWLHLNTLSTRLNKVSNWYLRQFKFGFIFLDSMVNEVWKKRLNLQNEVDKAKDVFICSCQEINYFNTEDYKFFVPKPALQEEIDTLAQKFTTGTIGIHIRSTDNEEAKKNSPFDLFIKKIEEEIDKNRGATFFLSTDNEQYQDILLKKYGRNKIIFHKKEFRRNITQGIMDAVIDIFCLSKTSRIYGSYWSSFSQVAARIGDIPFEILKKKTKTANAFIMLKLLEEILETRVMQINSAGDTITINSDTPKNQGLFLQKIYDQVKPKRSLEVGLAYGISTLFILEKCREHNLGEKCHIVIEPFDWGNAAEYNIEREDLSKYVEVRRDLSDKVITTMYLTNERIQFAYVDTTKVFDTVLQDFYFIDKILDVGGVVIFDDASTGGINMVMRFINSLPHYEILDKHEQTGFSKKYIAGEKIFEKLIGMIPFKKRFMPYYFFKTNRQLGLDYRCIAFKKIKSDEREWNWEKSF